jgi:hypothetical protein
MTVFIVETHVRNTSRKECRVKFSSRFPGVSVSTKSTICQLVNKFRTVLCQKMGERTRNIILEETSRYNGARFKHVYENLCCDSTVLQVVLGSIF